MGFFIGLLFGYALAPLLSLAVLRIKSVDRWVYGTPREQK